MGNGTSSRDIPHLCYFVCRTLPVSGGPQPPGPGTTKKPALWAVSSSGLFGWASPCAHLSNDLVRKDEEVRGDCDA